MTLFYVLGTRPVVYKVCAVSLLVAADENFRHEEREENILPWLSVLGFQVKVSRIVSNQLRPWDENVNPWCVHASNHFRKN